MNKNKFLLSFCTIGLFITVIYYLISSHANNVEIASNEIALDQMSNEIDQNDSSGDNLRTNSQISNAQSVDNEPSSRQSEMISLIHISDLPSEFKNLSLNMDNQTFLKLYPNAFNVGNSSTLYSIDYPNEWIKTVQLTFHSNAMEIKKGLLDYFRENFTLDSSKYKDLNTETIEEMRNITSDVIELSQEIKHGDNSFLVKIKITHREKTKDGAEMKSEDIIKDAFKRLGTPSSLAAHKFNSIFDLNGKVNSKSVNIRYGALALWDKGKYNICLRSNINPKTNSLGIVNLIYHLPATFKDMWKEGEIITEANAGNDEKARDAIDTLKRIMN